MPIPLNTNIFPFWLFPWNTDTWSGYTPFIFHKEILAIDAIRQLFVWKEFAFALLRMGEIPLWNPHNFAGSPLLGNFQTMLFYPFSWFFLILPNIWAWSLHIYIQPILAFLFMFLFLKTFLSKKASFFGALSFIFISFFATRYFWGVYVHSLLWLPLGLYAVQKLTGVKFILLATVFVVMTILGGYPQNSSFALIIFSLFFVFKRGFKQLIILIPVILLSLLITGIQLLPTAELYKYSIRESSFAQNVFKEGLLSTKYLVSIISPDFYGSPATNNYFGGKDYSVMNGYIGIIPFVFALISVLFLFRKDKNVKFWTILGIVGLLFAYETPLAYLPNILKIPILSSGSPGNDLFFFQFAGVMLGALGFDFVFSKNIKFKQLGLGILISLGLVSVLVIIGKDNQISFRNSALIGFILVVFAGGFLFSYLTKFKSAIIYISFGLLLLSGGYYLQKISPFGPSEYFYPNHFIITWLQQNAGVNRFVGFGGATFASNLETHYGIYGTGGYDSLWPKWYGELIASSKEGKIPKNINRADVIFSNYSGSSEQKILNLIGTKFFLDKSDNTSQDQGHDVLKFPKDQFLLKKRWGSLAVYENKNVLPRTFLANNVVVSGTDNVIDNLYKSDLKNTVVLEKDIAIKKLSTGSAVISSYKPNTVEIKTHSPNGPSILFLSDTYYPGWNAYVNNKKQEVLKANYAFRAVIVPKGQSKVIFKYEPNSFRYGAYLTAIGLIIFICLLLYSQKSKNTKHQ